MSKSYCFHSKSDVNESSSITDVTKYCIYVVYDTVLQHYDLPIIIPETKMYDYFNILVNDVQSKYYNHESDYVLYNVGEFNDNECIFNITGLSKVNSLDYFVNYSKRNLQTIIQTLNFLPSGYFKMPFEQKQQIQKDIDDKIVQYVERYVIPDLDINDAKENIITNLKNKIKDLEQRLDSSSANN